MNDPDKIKQELVDLVYAGRKEEAIQRLQQLHGATRKEAEQLLKLAVKESFTPVDFFKRAIKATAQTSPNKKGCLHTIFGLMAFGFGFFGIPMLLAAAGIFIYQQYFIANSTQLTGTVIQIEETFTNSSKAVIEYEVNGVAYTTRTGVSTNPPQYYMDDPVSLYVSLENSEDVLINNFVERWLMLTILGSLGTFFTVLMLIFYRKSR